METLEIEVDARDTGSKNKARRLRKSGKIPGVLYGPKTQPLPLELNRKDFSNRVAGLEGSHLVRLKSTAPGLAEKVALVKDVELHPISGDVIHTDCYEVDLTAKLQVHVPLHFVGKAVRGCQGAVSCSRLCARSRSNAFPMDIPEFFNVDVSGLDIGDSIHVEDLPIPEGVSAIYEVQFRHCGRRAADGGRGPEAGRSRR